MQGAERREDRRWDSSPILSIFGAVWSSARCLSREPFWATLGRMTSPGPIRWGLLTQPPPAPIALSQLHPSTVRLLSNDTGESYAMDMSLIIQAAHDSHKGKAIKRMTYVLISHIHRRDRLDLIPRCHIPRKEDNRKEDRYVGCMPCGSLKLPRRFSDLYTLYPSPSGHHQAITLSPLGMSVPMPLSLWCPSCSTRSSILGGGSSP